MEKKQSGLSRSRFVIWGVGVLASFTALRFFRTTESKAKGKTIKMLSQDGTLVAVDASAIQGVKRKITNDELQSWVKK